MAAVVSAAGAGMVVSLAVFLLIAGVLLAALRPLARSHRRMPPQIRTGTAALVGRDATVVERIANNEGVGCVRIDGEVWTARAYVDDDVYRAGHPRAGGRDPGRHGARDRMRGGRTEMTAGAIALIVLAVFAADPRVPAVRIVPQARAGIVERLGRYQRTLNPGLALIVPFVDRVKPLIDLREQVVSFPPQPVITEDNLVVGSTPSSTSR